MSFSSRSLKSDGETIRDWLTRARRLEEAWAELRAEQKAMRIQQLALILEEEFEFDEPTNYQELADRILDRLDG